MKKCVIFDLDGTLADTEPLHRESRCNILDEFGLDDGVSGCSVGISLRTFWGGLSKRYNLPFDGESLTKRNLAEVAALVKERDLKPFDGVAELLNALKAKDFVLAVASSSDRDYVAEVLEYLGIRQFFDCLVCGDEVENLKPAPDIYLKAVKLCGVTADAAVAVEDSFVGASAAKAAGLYCIGFKPASAQVEQKLDCCDCVITQMPQAVEIILKGEL